ncbi:hypothetical protein Phum_PHUM317730 [Pediculus humanus corporis]|uniref:Homeobox domain-containing protein n=1 Tax=Pediculus humanus subsp. corporis TaxID=121224 RepID=E0VMR5_PEDHC|nr:uncharacterized protein Phum_PHUM317730 [Pediculus humanus corporis]EEB14671.1 hypothetical protein Phum_PHUM317730 [Pediculus humanus corporis]
MVSLKKVSNVNKTIFTIDHILNVAGEKSKKNFFNGEMKKNEFEWLNCTRYKPPKLPRQRKKDGNQKRKLGRNPRIPFSSSQVAFLEATFLRTPYLGSDTVKHVASYLKLTEMRDQPETLLLI